MTFSLSLKIAATSLLARLGLMNSVKFTSFTGETMIAATGFTALGNAVMILGGLVATYFAASNWTTIRGLLDMVGGAAIALGEHFYKLGEAIEKRLWAKPLTNNAIRS